MHGYKFLNAIFTEMNLRTMYLIFWDRVHARTSKSEHFALHKVDLRKMCFENNIGPHLPWLNVRKRLYANTFSGNINPARAQPKTKSVHGNSKHVNRCIWRQNMENIQNNASTREDIHGHLDFRFALEYKRDSNCRALRKSNSLLRWSWLSGDADKPTTTTGDIPSLEPSGTIPQSRLLKGTEQMDTADTYK